VTEQNSLSGRQITAHPMFPTGVGVWFAALFSLSSLAIRGSLLEGLIIITHIDYLIPAATPPLGSVPRALMALAIAALGFHIGRKLGRRIAQSEAEATASANWAAASSAAYGGHSYHEPAYHEQAYAEAAPFVSAHTEHGSYAPGAYAETPYAESGARRPFQVHEEVGGYYPAEPTVWGQEAPGQYPAGISPAQPEYRAQPEYHVQGEYAAQGFYQPAFPADYPAQHQPQYHPEYQPDHQATYGAPYQPPYAAMPEAQPPVAPEYYHPGYAEGPPAGQHAAPFPPQVWPQQAFPAQAFPGEHYAQPEALAPEYAHSHAPAPAGSYPPLPELTPEAVFAPAHSPEASAPTFQTPDAPQEAVSWLHSSDAFSNTEEATEAFFAAPSEPADHAESHTSDSSSAAERLSGDALDKLSPLELVERLAMAMQRHEASGPPAPALEPTPTPDTLAGSFPFSSLTAQPAAKPAPTVGGEPVAPVRSALAALRGLK